LVLVVIGIFLGFAVIPQSPTERSRLAARDQARRLPYPGALRRRRRRAAFAKLKKTPSKKALVEDWGR
jgi:hypothetical protein